MNLWPLVDVLFSPFNAKICDIVPRVSHGNEVGKFAGFFFNWTKYGSLTQHEPQGVVASWTALASGSSGLDYIGYWPGMRSRYVQIMTRIFFICLCVEVNKHKSKNEANI